MRDPNVKMMVSDLFRLLGDFSRLSYAIDNDPSDETVAEWKRNGVQIIKENSVAFLRDLNDRLVKEKLIPNPDVVSCFTAQLEGIVSTHQADCENQEEKFLTTIYQNGLIHELDYVLFNSKYGVKSSDLKERLKKHRKDMARLERYLNRSEKLEKKSKDPKIKKMEKTRQMYIVIDIAYLNGRIEILSRFLKGMLKPIPTDYS